MGTLVRKSQGESLRFQSRRNEVEHIFARHLLGGTVCSRGQPTQWHVKLFDDYVGFCKGNQVQRLANWAISIRYDLDVPHDVCGPSLYSLHVTRGFSGSHLPAERPFERGRSGLAPRDPGVRAGAGLTPLWSSVTKGVLCSRTWPIQADLRTWGEWTDAMQVLPHPSHPVPPSPSCRVFTPRHRGPECTSNTEYGSPGTSQEQSLALPMSICCREWMW